MLTPMPYFLCKVNQYLHFYHANMFSNVCKFDEFRRIIKECYHIFQDFGLMDLRTSEPFRSNCRTFFSNLRTFGLKNLRTHESSNLRTFGPMRCNQTAPIANKPHGIKKSLCSGLLELLEFGTFQNMPVS